MMKGLILSNLIIAKDNLIPLAVTTLFIIIVGIIEDSHINAVVLIISAYPFLYIMCYLKDANLNWSRLEKVMPVKRSTIVLSKYLCFLIFLGMGCLILGIYTIVTSMVIGSMIWDSFLITLILLVVGVTISVGVFFYPSVFKLREDRADAALMIAFILSGVLLYLAVQVGMRVLDLGHIFEILKYQSFWVAYVIGNIILFVISYFISKPIYAKKEF